MQAGQMGAHRTTTVRTIEGAGTRLLAGHSEGLVQLMAALPTGGPAADTYLPNFFLTDTLHCVFLGGLMEKVTRRILGTGSLGQANLRSFPLRAWQRRIVKERIEDTLGMSADAAMSQNASTRRCCAAVLLRCSSDVFLSGCTCPCREVTNKCAN